MRPWSFWTSRANSEPLPIEPRQDSQAKSPLAEQSETSWSAGHKVYATSAPGGWDEQPEPQLVGQPYIIQPEDPIFHAFGRSLVLNRMDSPVQEPDDSVSSIIRGVHEDEVIELVALIKELREQAARDAELIAELRGQAEDNAHAIGVARIESERAMKELSAAASEARAAAAAAAAAAATANEIAANSPPTHRSPTPPTHTPPPRSSPPHSPSPRSPLPRSPPPHIPQTLSPPPRSPSPHIPPTHSPPPRSPPPHIPPTHSPPTRNASTHTPPSPPKKGDKKKLLKQAPPVSTPSSPKTTYTHSPSLKTVPQPTPSSPDLTIFETYDRMVNLLKTKPRTDIQLGDYPWPMFPEPAGSFPQRIAFRSEVNKGKVCACVPAYTSAYGPGRRKERGDAMVKAWKSIVGRSEDLILNGTVARAFSYIDMAARSQ